MAPRQPPAGADKTLSKSVIATYAVMGGFTGENVNIAAAVALAESSGRTAIIGGPNDDGSSDYGLWQINSIHAKLFDTYSDWWNPISNARMAHAVWAEAGGSFSPWVNYSNGKYKDHLGNTQYEAVPSSDGIVDTVKGIGGMVWRAGQWMADPDNWVRVVQVTLGAGLLIAATTIVVRPAVDQVSGAIPMVKGLKG